MSGLLRFAGGDDCLANSVAVIVERGAGRALGKGRVNTQTNVDTGPSDASVVIVQAQVRRTHFAHSELLLLELWLRQVVPVFFLSLALLRFEFFYFRQQGHAFINVTLIS